MKCAVSFGGGVNSTALLVGMVERDWTPDAILFADTGGERDYTYEHVRAFSCWLVDHGLPPITTVSANVKHKTLEEECLSNNTLPSLAFGSRACSVKWKRQPQEQHIRSLGWRCPVLKLIGIDAGEQHRALKIANDKRWHYRFPLIEWGWARDECVEAIVRAGVQIPRKSSCWFCPASKKGEVLGLPRELQERAVQMERNARDRTETVRGLGRRWSWEKFLLADAAQSKLFPDAQELPCACFDGEDND